MLFTDYSQFIDHIGMLISSESFEPLTISPCTQFGHFDRKRVDDLLAFCLANPDFHIASRLNPNVVINRLALGAKTFYLASGDRDSHIIYDTTASRQDLDVLELRATQSAT